MRQFLTKKDPFTLPLTFLVILPGGITIPLSEAESVAELAPRLFVSIGSICLALFLIVLLKPLYKTRFAHWSLTPTIAFLAGGSRGLAMYLMLQELDLSGTSVESRIAFGGIAWAIALTLGALVIEAGQSALSNDSKLRRELREAQLSQDSLDQQLQWLKRARIEGLDKEIANQLASLVTKLNQEGLGPGAFRAIAEELRSAAREQVRAKSISVWNSAKPILRARLISLLAVPPSPLLVLLAFGVPALINAIRIDSDLAEITVTLAGAVVAGAWTLLAHTTSISHHVTFLPVGVITAIVSLSLGQSPLYTWTSALAAMLWGQAIVYFSAAMAALGDDNWPRLLAARDVVRKEKERLSYLNAQLEAQQLEIAKYLHAILQTRLMSYALAMEGQGLSKREIEDLTKLLQNPMGRFAEASGSLDAMLLALSERWEPLVKIKFELHVSLQGLDSLTVQIVEEAIANAVRHGEADTVLLTVTDEQERTIVVGDNGLGPRLGAPGLGSSIFSTLSASWELRPGPEFGSEFKATLVPQRV